MTTEYWAVVGEAFVIFLACVGVYAIAVYVGRGVDR